MPDMAVQTDAVIAPNKAYPTPPETPPAEPERVEHLFDVYEKLGEGQFRRKPLIFTPANSTLAVHLHVEKMTIAAEKVVVEGRRKDSCKFGDCEHKITPGWVDNMEHRIYSPFRFIVPFVKPVLETAYKFGHWMGGIGMGVNLGFVNFRSL